MELNVICFHWGDWGYPLAETYINRLYRGVKRHLDMPFRFICFTDMFPRPVMEGIELRPLMVPSWEWNLRKLYAYCPYNGLHGRVLVFDLDIVVVGNLGDLATCFADFATCRGAYRLSHMGGSLQSFSAGYRWNFIWKEITTRYEHWKKVTRGSERKFFNHVFKQYNEPWTAWEDILPGQVVSYKRDCRNGLPPDARVVRFHGKPRPHQVPDKWVGEYWQ